jgi:hypothetical protein
VEITLNILKTSWNLLGFTGLLLNLFNNPVKILVTGVADDAGICQVNGFT